MASSERHTRKKELQLERRTSLCARRASHEPKPGGAAPEESPAKRGPREIHNQYSVSKSNTRDSLETAPCAAVPRVRLSRSTAVFTAGSRSPKKRIRSKGRDHCSQTYRASTGPRQGTKSCISS